MRKAFLFLTAFLLSATVRAEEKETIYKTLQDLLKETTHRSGRLECREDHQPETATEFEKTGSLQRATEVRFRIVD